MKEREHRKRKQKKGKEKMIKNIFRYSFSQNLYSVTPNLNADPRVDKISESPAYLGMLFIPHRYLIIPQPSY